MAVFSTTKAELIIKAVVAPDTLFYQITVSRWFEEKRHILLALFTAVSATCQVIQYTFHGKVIFAFLCETFLFEITWDKGCFLRRGKRMLFFFTEDLVARHFRSYP